MIVNFHKMQALGNDFVIVEHRYSSRKLFTRESIMAVSHRLYGVGCDQIVVFYRENCFVHASFFNNDGGEAEICGNASRCLGKLMKRFYGMLRFTIVAAGKDYDIQVNNDDTVSVNVGHPSFSGSAIGLSREVADPMHLSLTHDLQIEEKKISKWGVTEIACVSAGNPHLVLFLDKIPPLEKVAEIGKILSLHRLFSNGINVSFSKIISDSLIEQSSFERGAGLTMACGSGACATAFLAGKLGLINGRNVVVQQRGGNLFIEFKEDESIMQTGPAFYVFSGSIEL
ncbi:MAG: diaminopimelate epimerase [Holosporaceae bacterium]|jgi:diaminopimelate epimerase|nr:diaminopimelate epimerase [Holosporaceae bacterium]